MSNRRIDSIQERLRMKIFKIIPKDGQSTNNNLLTNACIWSYHEENQSIVLNSRYLLVKYVYNNKRKQLIHSGFV